MLKIVQSANNYHFVDGRCAAPILISQHAAVQMQFKLSNTFVQRFQMGCACFYNSELSYY